MNGNRVLNRDRMLDRDRLLLLMDALLHHMPLLDSGTRMCPVGGLPSRCLPLNRELAWLVRGWNKLASRAMRLRLPLGLRLRWRLKPALVLRRRMEPALRQRRRWELTLGLGRGMELSLSLSLSLSLGLVG